MLIVGGKLFLGLRERKRLGVLSLDEVLEQEKIVKDEETSGSEETVLVGAGASSAAGSGAGSASGDDKVRTTKSTGGAGSGTDADAEDDDADDVRLQGLDPNRPTLRPKLYWFNALLTVSLLTAMIMEWLPIPVLFILGAALALTVNFPHIPDQKDRLAAHADNVLNVSGMVFAAAVFTGVLQGTGMVDSMAVGQADTVLPVVPMFHANAWGFPFTSAFTGSSTSIPACSGCSSTCTVTTSRLSARVITARMFLICVSRPFTNSSWFGCRNIPRTLIASPLRPNSPKSCC